MKRHVPLLGDSVCDHAFELGSERKHGAENFADWSQVVVGDPAAEAQEEIVEDGSRVDNAENILGGDLWFAVVEIDHDAHHPLLAKGDEDTSSNYRDRSGRDTIGKRHIEGHGDGNVAEVGHWLEG
jgi:hypothetical protein